MPERKHSEKNKPLPELRSSVTEILVVNGRAFQPFIRTFRYTGENVTKQNLGTLIGVFEIDDQSEDSAYIVNFLASVAKKEYFNNPRRGAVESFEAALHKINLALAELVKHGNVTWLGKFHGSLGVLEKNNLHFSVSGKASILLLRNGTIADISEGLASDESHIHPIKTFVEVSSGRLNSDDQILLTSPELLALFSLEDLNKHASRMGGERFTQFLKTALVNELDMAGLMVVDVTESLVTEEEKKPVKKEEVTTPVNNVFSQSAFAAKKQSSTPSVQEVLVAEQKAKEEEYIDSKTGHIYVQGETPEPQNENPFFEAISQKTAEFPRHFSALASSLGKRLRKGKKQAMLWLGVLGEASRTAARKTARAIRRQTRRLEEARRARAAARAAEETRLAAERAIQEELDRKAAKQEEVLRVPMAVSDIPRPKPIAQTSAETMETPVVPQRDTPPEAEASQPAAVQNDTFELPSFMKEKLAQFYQKTPPEIAPTVPSEPESPRRNWQGIAAQVKTHTRNTTLSLLSQTRVLRENSVRLLGKLPSPRLLTDWFRLLCSRVASFFRNLSLRQKYLLFGGMAVLCLGAGVWYFFTTSRATETTDSLSREEILNTGVTPTEHTLPASGEMTVALGAVPEALVTSVILGDQTYAITKKNIVPITETKTFPLPSGEQARFATAMDDLRLIFIYTENGKLYAWSPISKTFVENTLPFEGTPQVAGIDTYLTYLYVLDSQSDQVYRFPRADSGFGAGTPWLKEGLAIEETSHLAVNETLFIAPDTATIKGFFRGRAASTLELPSDGLSVTDLYTHPGLENVYALDSEHKRIVIWNQDGRLIKELPHDKLADGLTLSVNEKQGEFFIGTQNSLLSYKLK